MNKYELMQILAFFLIIITATNYYLHASIIEQDKEIREKALQYVSEYCIEDEKTNQGLNFIFNTTLVIDENGKIK